MQGFISVHAAALLAVSGALLLSGILMFIFLRLRLYRAFRGDGDAGAEKKAPRGFSVVICSHDSGDELAAHLPAILEQRGVEMEVVVVDDCSSDNTTDVIKRLSQRYSNLRHTFVPRTARYVSHAKLAVTLGVKAARYDWIVLTQPTCAPLTDLWLKSLSNVITGDTVAVLGYANYADDGSIPARRAVFERLSYSALWFLSASSGAIGGDGGNMALRKDAFLAAEGYAGSLETLYGVDDLLAFSLSRLGEVKVCTSRAATVREFTPDIRRTWRQRRRMRAASFAGVSRISSPAFLTAAAADAGVLLAVAGTLAGAAVAAMTQIWAALAAFVVAAAALSAADISKMRRVSRITGERNFTLSLIYYRIMRPLTAPLWRMRAKIRKRDFIRKI